MVGLLVIALIVALIAAAVGWNDVTDGAGIAAEVAVGVFAAIALILLVALAARIGTIA